MLSTSPVTARGPIDENPYEFFWQCPYLDVFLASDVGRKRSQNEDACLLCAPGDAALEKERGLIVAVADGMGGVSGGACASGIALDAFVDTYYTTLGEKVPQLLEDTVAEGNRRVFDKAIEQPELKGMGTTVSALAIVGDHAYIVQVGDSRVYLARPNSAIWQITDDHSLVAEQVRHGLLSEEAARTHSLKNLITRAVGTKPTVRPDLFVVKLSAGDTLLICTDGLSNVVRDPEIAERLKDPDVESAAKSLIDAALDAGGPDNVTVAVVRVTSNPPRTLPQEGATRISLSKPTFMEKLKKFIT